MPVPSAPIIAAIESQDPHVAAALALEQPPALLLEAFDYHRITDSAEPYFEFTKAWIALAEPLDKPVIARWAVDMSVSEFAYLEVQAEAVALLSSAVREAKDHLAGLIDDLKFISQGPDAGISKTGIAEFRHAADRLRELAIP